MRRRNFVKGIVGSAAAWPLAARAQQTDQVRRIGVLMGYASTDPEGQALLAEFTRHLAELGWAEGRNVRIDVRWGGSSVDLLHTFAKELIGLQPDVLLASSTPTTAALARETQTIPIIFTLVADPIGSRFVASLSHPGGNITGFSVIEASVPSKSLAQRARAGHQTRRHDVQSRHRAHRELDGHARVRDRRQVIQYCDAALAQSQKTRGTPL
jgi:putative ABC transport system substrate-binding protein